MTLPANLQPFAHRKVRCVVSNMPLLSLAELSHPGKREWTRDEWSCFLLDLDRSELTVEEWARHQEARRVDL